MVRATAAVAQDGKDRGDGAGEDRQTSDLSELHEFLISQGHRDSDLWSYSIEKCVYLAHLAHKRVGQAEARATLWMARAIRSSVWADKDAAVKFDDAMEKAAGLKPPEPVKQKRNRALNALAERIARKGGKVING